MQWQNFILWSLVALAGTGCRTAPKFNPRNASAMGDATPPIFASLAWTNQLPREWLTPPRDFYRLGPGDALDVEILGDPASRAQITVGPDGKIYYGLLPGTMVWGLTLSQAKEVMEGGLGKYIRVKPELALSLTTAVSRRIWLLGNVRRPGVYPLSTPLSLLEAISAAGGTLIVPGAPDDGTDLENSFVMREGKVLAVNLHKLLRQGDLSQNIYLQPDDFVYLRSASAKEISVLGAVVRPNLMDYTEHTTLLSAIATAGGTAPYAYVSHVVVIRGALTQPMVATVDYNAIRHGQATDVRLRPGDIVYVPFRPFQKLEVLAQTVLESFVRTVAVNEGYRAVIPNAAPVGVSVPVSSGP